MSRLATSFCLTLVYHPPVLSLCLVIPPAVCGQYTRNNWVVGRGRKSRRISQGRFLPPPGEEWTPIVSVASFSCWPLGSHALPCFQLCFFRTMKQLLFWDFERCTWSKGPLSPVLQLLIRMNGWIDDRKTDGWMFYVELLGDILPSIISFF